MFVTIEKVKMTAKSAKTIHEPIIATSVVMFLVLTFLIGFSLYWNITNLQQEKLNLATDEARANWNKDQAFRGWATKHGGLYVKPNERTPPSPYLAHLPKRDVVTTDGTNLTLMNPAYMMSQMTKEYEDSYGIKGSITGKVLLNPANEPDDWERKALDQFDQGIKEVVDETLIDGEPYIRLMKPMVMKQGCVKCHGHLGFKVGDIRGGVSVSIPLKPYYSAANNTIQSMQITHVVVWGFGVFALLAYARFARNREMARLQLQEHINQQNSALLDAEKRSRQLLESAGEGIFGLDEKGSVTFINPAALKMLGYSSEELIGQRFHTIVQYSHMDGSAYPEKKSPISDVITNSEVKNVSDEIMWRKDGSHFPIEYNATPIEKNNHLGGAVVVFTDISERLHNEKLKSEFISTVSHELRTPLTSIRGSLGLISGGVLGELPEKIQSMLKIAGNNTDRLLLLINDLLDMQKIESNQMVFNKQKFEVMPFIEQVLEESAGYGKIHDVRFVLKKALPGAHIVADKDRITQVMSNLLSNAAKFSPDGSEVEIFVDQIDSRLKISVTDYGTGIPKEFHASIFEKFTQLDSSDTRKTGSTGLGLNISKAIIENHDGHINFHSEEGLGTTFYIELPNLEIIL